MTTAQESLKSKRGQLRITQERVVGIVMRIIDSDGLDMAKEQFRLLNNLFSTERGWAETAEEVYAIFAEEQKRLRKERLAEQLEMVRAGAPNVYQVLPNAQTGVNTSVQFNDTVGQVIEHVDSINNNEN